MSQYRFQQFHFDTRNGELQDVTKKETTSLRNKLNELLQYLIEHRDRPVTKDELLQKLWKNGEYRESSLTQSIRELRKALGDNAQAPLYIKTYPQRGYQWVCPLKSAEDKKTQYKTRRWLAGAIIASILIVAIVLQLQPENTPTPINDAVPNLLVMPFINETGDPSYQWVEHGLSDMLAVSLQRTGLVRVTPPALASGMLAAAQMQWPTLPVHLRSLMTEYNVNQALVASVREHNANQVLDFQLLHADGRVQQGSIRYASLPNATTAITNQLIHLMRPEHRTMTPIETSTPKSAIAWQAAAEGMSALRREGPKQARDFFHAGHLLLPNEGWITAYLAQAQTMLGQWKVATKTLNSISDTKDDTSLAAFTHFLKADLNFRQGLNQKTKEQLQQAITHALAVDNIQVLADSYRLMARLAWYAMEWEEHTLWLLKANALFIGASDLRIEAEKLFYLGNPIARGLEKDPQQDLLLSQTQVTQALNYYTQLGYREKIAASYFALAQNYHITIEAREASLNKTISLYRELHMPYELAEVLLYGGFFHLQLHDGSEAEKYFNQVHNLLGEYPNHRLKGALNFYSAFAILDQGLDQRDRGGHGTVPAKLHQAITALDAIIENSGSKMDHANSLTFKGWALSDLGHYEQAINAYQQGKEIHNALNMETTSSYSNHAMMHAYLAQGDYQRVIALAEEPANTRWQLTYVARAHYELGNYGDAVENLNRLKETPNFWQESIDRDRLKIYQNAKTATNKIKLAPEPKPHTVYCESDWEIHKEASQQY